MKLHLSGPQLGKIKRVIVSAYVGGGPNALSLLNQALTDNLENRTVFEHVNVYSPFDLQVGELLAKANGEGWLPSLLGAVRADKPDREDLQELLRSFLSTVSAGQVLDAVAGAPTLSETVRADLQQILPGGAIVNPETMRRRMCAVCRVDYADLSPPGAGTGFLVGADLVLTNWHVLKRVIEAPAAAANLRFRFDLLSADAAANSAGRVAHAASNGSPLLCAKPPGGVELPSGVGEPTMEQLDYALVRLAERVGDDSASNMAGGETRGHFALRRTMPELSAGASLMVLQHPLRGELQFAIGSALGPNDTGSRLKHTAATQNGSSGSPVLDSALDLIALHNGARFGTPRASQSFNTAVPIKHVVGDLIKAGVTEMLQE